MLAPLVSVIMPCFNAGKMLRAALDSVIHQTHPNLEIIFVDNLSSDGSAGRAKQILEAGTRGFKLAECARRGVNYARNHGYQFVRGDYVQWMDADDELDRDKIALQVAALERSPEADIAYGDWSSRVVSSVPPYATERHRLGEVSDQVLRTLATVWYPPHLYLLRRTAADRLQAEQGFWSGRPVETDIEYSAVAALLGFRFLYVVGAHVHHNVWSEHQLSRSKDYSRRAASLCDIFRRLQDLARSQLIRAKLGSQHKTLLHQNWDIWRMPSGSVSVAKTPGRGFRLTHVASGKEMVVRPKEAAVVQALLTAPYPRTFCHHALGIADRVPALSGEHAFIIDTLERLRRAGFLELTARVAPPAAAPTAALGSDGASADRGRAPSSASPGET